MKWPLFLPKRFGRRRGALLFGLLFFITLGVWLQNSGTKRTIQEYAEQVIEVCASDVYHPACYDEEIPKLMEFLSMEEAFAVTRIVQDQDSSYRYCHVLGHKLSAREAQKDPIRWMDVIPRCPSDGMCSNGCLHGALQEYFRNDVLTADQLERLKPDLQNACEPRGSWDPTPIERTICYHGLGHLLVIATGAQMTEALKICDAIALRPGGQDLSSVCYEGAFMQIFQPLEPEDIAIAEGVAPKERDQLKDFCETFTTELARASCWIEGWTLFRPEIVSDAATITTFCSEVSAEHRNNCHSMIFNVLGQSRNFESEEIVQVCAAMPLDVRGQCFADAASSMTQADVRFIERSVQLCALARDVGADEECYEKLMAFVGYRFHRDSSDFLTYCNAFPEPWASRCRETS